MVKIVQEDTLLQTRFQVRGDVYYPHEIGAPEDSEDTLLIVGTKESKRLSNILAHEIGHIRCGHVKARQTAGLEPYDSERVFLRECEAWLWALMHLPPKEVDWELFDTCFSSYAYTTKEKHVVAAIHKAFAG